MGPLGLWFYGSLDPLCLDMALTVQAGVEFWVCFVGSGETPSPPPSPPVPPETFPPLADPPPGDLPPNVSLITRKE